MGRLVCLVVFMSFFVSACSNSDWRTASREPAGIAPSPEQTTEAVIEVYAADAFSWRGWFAVHTWIAVKAEKAEELPLSASDPDGTRLRPLLSNGLASASLCR